MPQNSALPESTMVPGLPCVASRNVPVSASTMASTSAGRGSRLLRRDMKIRISTGPVYCSTVAVPAFDAPMAEKYVYWHMLMPSTPKITMSLVSFLKTSKMRLPSRTAHTSRSKRPAAVRRMGTMNSLVSPLVCRRYWPHVPEKPQSMPPSRVSSAPRSALLFFMLHASFVV